MMLYFVSFVFLLLIPVIITGSTCLNQQSIEDLLKDVHIPNAAIIVVDAKNILYEQSFTHPSFPLVEDIAAQESIFTLGSISKTFVAIAIMQLVEINMLNLDTDINMYLLEPSRQIHHPIYTQIPITLRHLLSHTASIATPISMNSDYLFPNDNAFEQMTLADMCFTYLNNTSNWLPLPPGNVTLYSNEGTSLSALIVERVVGISYEKYVKEKIIKPLGLANYTTGFRLSDFNNREELIKHYAYADNGYYLAGWHQALPQLNITSVADDFPTWLHIPFYSFVGYPAYTLRMSTRSLSIFLQMFINNGSNLLQSSSINEIRKIVGNGNIPNYNQTSNSESTSIKYGLLWYWKTASNNRRIFGHDGAIPGVTTSMFINEQGTIGVIILTNGDVSFRDALSQTISKTIETIYLSFFDCFEYNGTNSFFYCKQILIVKLISSLVFLYILMK